ncbi:MAG: redox-sensing transcriptional repressor Rex [Pseudorhodobacter sp.]|nr:redox-sensing transcriptional repressor Rex [Frankiaceae bacterium]
MTSPGTSSPRVPEATIARLPVYLRALHEFAEAGSGTVRSAALATAVGVGSATLRKDLSHLGSYGTRGVGYDVEHLVAQVSRELGVSQRCSVVLVGIGNLGRALAGYDGFAARGLAVAALLDSDPTLVGQQVGGLVVRHVDELPAVLSGSDISIGVIATPAGAAQQVCDQLVAAGVTSVLNFAPVLLTVPDHVDLREVDLSVELLVLSFHEHRKASRAQASA